MARLWAPEDRSQAAWPTIACQVEAEELLITHAPEVPADVARAIIRELVTAGRVPPRAPDAWDTPGDSRGPPPLDRDSPGAVRPPSRGHYRRSVRHRPGHAVREVFRTAA
jgi:hypothetical protein